MSNSNLQAPQTIVIFWDGPYSVEEVKALGRREKINGNGFYLIVGTLKKHELKSLDYCGITTRSFGTRILEHEQIGRFDRFKRGEVEIWLGNCEQPANPDDATLRRAEKMLIQGWKIEGNLDGKATFPAPTCLVMRWYFTDWRVRKRRPDFVRDLPDVLWFEDDFWWTGKLRAKDAK